MNSFDLSIAHFWLKHLHISALYAKYIAENTIIPFVYSHLQCVSYHYTPHMRDMIEEDEEKWEREPHDNAIPMQTH